MPTDLATLLPLAAGLLAAGTGAGLLAGLLGVGGGIVVVPVLFHLFTLFQFDESVAMLMAVGTSLGAMVPTSLSSARSHFKRGAVDLALVRRWGVAIVAGVAAGTAIASAVRGQVLTLVFGIVTLAVAANLALRGEGRAVWPRMPGGVALQAIAFVIGVVSSLMGIGGGMLSVPVMSACSYPMRKAVATAAANGVLIALPGAVGFIIAGLGAPGRPPASLGYVNLVGFALIVPATVLAAPWGARIAHSISPRWLRWSFVAFLLATGVRMLWRALA